MSLSVTVLGCAGSYPEPGNACSGYLVRSATTTVAVDLGSGTLANLQRHVAIADLDAVVLSHQHPDHWIDLPILRNAMRYYLGVEGLPVYGPVGVLRQAEAVIENLAPTLDWNVPSPGKDLQIGDQTYAFSVTDHPVETLAMRISADGRSLVYSADTGSGWTGRRELLDGSDLFLCEATMAEEREDQFQHLTARQAGAWAAEAGVERLVLTHVAANIDPEEQRVGAAAVFPGPVELARVNETFVV